MRKSQLLLIGVFAVFTGASYAQNERAPRAGDSRAPVGDQCEESFASSEVKYDRDQDGEISRQEFMAARMAAAEAAWESYDADGNGALTVNEAKHLPKTITEAMKKKWK